jgi:hypothetical protein
VVSQACGLLTEAVRASGLDSELSRALAPWRKSLAMHNPAKIVTDLVVTLGLGENRLADIAVLRRRAGSVGAGEVGSDGVAHDQRAAADAPRVLAAISVRASKPPAR